MNYPAKMEAGTKMGTADKKGSRKGREIDEDTTTASFSGEEKNRRDANERPARRRDSGRMRGSHSRGLR